jgi:hypothetical protein
MVEPALEAARKLFPGIRFVVYGVDTNKIASVGPLRDNTQPFSVKISDWGTVTVASHEPEHKQMATLIAKILEEYADE